MDRSQIPSLQDTEMVLLEVFRHTPVGVVLSDLHGTIIDLNESLCAMVGYARAELVGRKLTDITHPDDLADIEARFDSLREGSGAPYVVDRRYITRSGEIIFVKISVSVIHARNGEPVCGIGFIENMTERVKIETELRQSELRYRRVVEDQTDMIVRCRPDGTRTFVNQAYCRYNAATADKLLGTSFFSLIPEPDRQRVIDKYASLTPENPVATEQHWAIAPGGEWRWHEWTDRALFDENGRLVEIQAVGRDLTEQHEAQQRLAKSEERYRGFFNNLPIAAWENDWSRIMADLRGRGIRDAATLREFILEKPERLHEVGRAMRIVGANQAALDMARVNTREEFQDWLRKGPWTAESGLRLALHLARVIFGDEQGQTEEYTLVRANGEPLNVLYRVARSVRWSEDWMMFPVAVDITERKRIELELTHRFEVSTRAEAAAHFGSWEWNPVEDVIYGSDEFWRLLDGRDGGGPRYRRMEDCLALMHPEDHVTALARWHSLRDPASGEKPAMLERDYRFVRADGSVAIAHGQSFLHYTDDGKLSRAFGIMRDITDMVRAEQEAVRHREQLERADKMITLGILVSGIAHEINNPNHTIGLNVPLLRNAWRDAAAVLAEVADENTTIGGMPWQEARDEVSAMIADVHHASERIRAIVTELRNFALDHDPGVRRRVSANAVVAGALRLLGKHISRATRQFELKLAQDEPFVTANSSRLEQVVVNLVLNACQALENDLQAISIETGADGARAFIRVRDEGRGIAAADLANIRAPFFTTKRAEGGTGLGLAVSDRIASEQGGELAFESVVGNGTTATLWLPLEEQ
jgi:PAS domain S-box-containing protein